MVLRENFKEDYTFTYVQEISGGMMDGAVLICREDVLAPSGFKVVNMIEELARDLEPSTHDLSPIIKAICM